MKSMHALENWLTSLIVSWDICPDGFTSIPTVSSVPFPTLQLTKLAVSSKIEEAHQNFLEAIVGVVELSGGRGRAATNFNRWRMAHTRVA